MALITVLGLPVLGQTGPTESVVQVAEVEVRSGPSQKYYPTGRLRRGDRIQVVREEGDFLAILPPPGSFSWINGRFIERDEKSKHVARVLGDKVPVLIGSSVSSEKPTVQQVALERGAQVIILGDPHVDEDGKWWPIQSPAPREVRYIPRSAVQLGPPAVEAVAGASPGSTAAGAVGSGAPSAAAPGGVDPLWQQAQQAEQNGDLNRAKELYRQLARQTADHNLTILCYNRIRFLEEGNRGSAPPGYQPGVPQVASYNGPPRLTSTPAPVTAQPASRAVSHYTYQKEPAPAAGQAPPVSYAPPAPAAASVAAPTPQSSGPGRLTRAGFFVDGRQAYVLETSQGRARMYVTGMPGLNLEPYVNRVVELFGPMVYRGDLRTNYMTASQVRPVP
jgi:hypothetical protein